MKIVVKAGQGAYPSPLLQHGRCQPITNSLRFTFNYWRSYGKVLYSSPYKSNPLTYDKLSSGFGYSYQKCGS